MLSPAKQEPIEVIYNPVSTCDIETDKTGLLLYASLFYNGDIYEIYSDWDDWLDRVIKLSKKIKTLRIIWAHNGGNFDWQHLFEHINKSRSDIQVKAIMSGSNCIGLELKPDKSKYAIWLNDSLRILPLSLDKLTHDFKIETPKLKINSHPADLLRDNPELFFEYLRVDTISLYQCIMIFWKTINEKIIPENPLHKLKRTIASTAMTIYRKKYLRKNILTPSNKKQIQYEKKSYHGGLVSCPNHGIYDNCIGLDVNSMYPYAMTTQEVPSSYIHTWTRKYIPGKLGIYYVEFETNESEFLYIYNENGSLSKSGKGYLTSIEIEDILENGGSIKVINGFVYWRAEKLLKNYAYDLYDIKSTAVKNKNKSLEIISKLFLNSLYGKFGQSATAFSYQTMSLDEQRKRMKRGQKIKDYGNVVAVEEEIHSEYSFIGIASFITARSRLNLIKAIRANREKALYCDTDSLFIQGYPIGLSIGPKLGEWKIEFEGAELHLAGKKTYAILKNGIVEKIRMKGVPLKRSFEDDNQKSIYLNSVLSKLDACIIDIYHGEKFLYSTPPTNRDVLILGKKSAKWENKTRTVRVTSDKAQLERGIQFELDKITRNENRVIAFEKSQARKEFRRVILGIGGISPYRAGYWHEEMSVIPVSMKRLTGVPLDQIVEILKSDYPGYGIETENDLIEYIQKYY